MHGRGLRVNPAKLSGAEELFWPERDSEYDLRVCDFLLNILIRVQLNHLEFWELDAQPFRKPWRSDPQVEAMVGDDEQLAHGLSGHRTIWRITNSSVAGPSQSSLLVPERGAFPK